MKISTSRKTCRTSNRRLHDPSLLLRNPAWREAAGVHEVKAEAGLLLLPVRQRKDRRGCNFHDSVLGDWRFHGA